MGVVSRAEHARALDDLRAEIAEPRGGILGPDSTAWRIGGDLSVFVGGGRAALLQLAHPMVAYAIEQHSTTRDDVVGRFQRTFKNVFAMVFGELDDAIAAGRRVHSVHTRIIGTIPDAIGGYAAGTPYHANDAAALRWVHATLIDTTLVVCDRLGKRLVRGDRDAYVREMNRFAALFGIPRDMWPADHAAHARYMDRMLASNELAVAPCAKEMAGFLFGNGTTALGRITEAVTASLLPPHLVRDFALRGSPMLVRVGLAATGTAIRLLPAPLVAIPARSEAQRRLAGRGPSALAAWTERRLFGLARSIAK